MTVHSVMGSPHTYGAAPMGDTTPGILRGEMLATKASTLETAGLKGNIHFICGGVRPTVQHLPRKNTKSDFGDLSPTLSSKKIKELK